MALFILYSFSASAQGSQGNTTIFSGGQMTFFGDHNFATGGAGTMPGIINTERTATYGILNYSSASLNVIGADDDNHVDGYVRNLGAGDFLYPVGDNGAYRPFAANGAGTTGAYFGVDPNLAITSKQGGGDYLELPDGETFPTADKDDLAIQTVSTKEYWDIDGSNASSITLTWDANSDISTLTGGNLLLLTIVGWNPTTLQWEEVPSTVDVTSVLGGSSILGSGSITTDAAIVPGSYTVYSFAGKVDPLPVVLTHFDAAKEGNTVVLNWATTMETNSDYFDIERSLEGKSWVTLERKAATGESNVLKQYQYVDKSPLVGENLYRLKMVDKDNTFAYSRIRSVVMDETVAELAVYPNPASEYVMISKAYQVSTYSMVNIRGTQVMSDLSKLDNEGKLQISDLTPGMYALQVIRKDGSQSTHKIIIAN